MDYIYSIMATGYLNYIPGLQRSSQKCKKCSQYDTDVVFSSTMQGPFVLNTNLWLGLQKFILSKTLFYVLLCYIVLCV